MSGGGNSLTDQAIATLRDRGFTVAPAGYQRHLLNGSVYLTSRELVRFSRYTPKQRPSPLPRTARPRRQALIALAKSHASIPSTRT